MRGTKAEQRTMLWKLKMEECRVAFTEKLRQALGGAPR